MKVHKLKINGLTYRVLKVHVNYHLFDNVPIERKNSVRYLIATEFGSKWCLVYDPYKKEFNNDYRTYQFYIKWVKWENDNHYDGTLVKYKNYLKRIIYYEKFASSNNHENYSIEKYKENFNYDVSYPSDYSLELKWKFEEIDALNVNDKEKGMLKQIVSQIPYFDSIYVNSCIGEENKRFFDLKEQDHQRLVAVIRISCEEIGSIYLYQHRVTNEYHVMLVKWYKFRGEEHDVIMDLVYKDRIGDDKFLKKWHNMLLKDKREH